MSEQTPDTNNGVSEGQEPSMEDILASIRQIIAEDDGQLSDQADANIDRSGTETLKGDVSELAQSDSVDLDIVEDMSAPLVVASTGAATSLETTDLDALIGDLDAGGIDTEVVSATDALPVAKSDDVLDLMIPLQDSDSAMDELEDLTLDVDVADLANAELSSADMPEDNLGLILDNMLEDTGHAQDDGMAGNIDLLEEDSVLEDLAIENLAIEESAIEESASEELVIDPAEDLLDEIELHFEDDPSSDKPQTDPDIDLVKSLMADLTEEPLYDNAAEELEDIASEDIDDMDEPENDILDEILSMTLDDETQISEELEIPSLTALETPEPIMADVPGEGLSLKEIAAQAMADAGADSVEETGDSKSNLIAGAAALAGLGAAGATISAAQDDNADHEAGLAEQLEDVPELEAVSEDDDVEDILSDFDDLLAVETDIDTDLTPDEPVKPEPEPLIEETPDMARAKKTDTIIDEVTETASAGAFASLNQVVEEKAVVAERGDRIGDLVQEALRPMLKEWLDKNLKGIVERAVTKEVKRISSGK